ncbi:hypothetical protein MMC21_001339 [Puttea exsequens]|nr:hypothetical protein [Puttea exsequens]
MAPKAKGHERDAVPGFGADALLGLTQKIESNLKKAGKEAESEAPKSVGKEKKFRKKQDTNGQKPVKASENQKSGINGTNSSKPRSAHGTVDGTQKPKQGKKRARDGTFRTTEHEQNGVGASSTERGKKKNKPSKQERALVEKDILDLGGSKDDIKLINEAVSDSEMEGVDALAGCETTPALTKELQHLIRQLGVDQELPANASDPFEAEEEGESEAPKLRIDKSPKSSKLDSTGNVADASSTRTPGKRRMNLTFKPQQDWHGASIPVIPTLAEEQAALPLELIDHVHGHAKSLLERENKVYAAHNPSVSSAHQFYSTIMSTGTLSDKISALTLSVQESPVHNVRALENLVSLGRKRSRGQAVEVLGALRDLFGPGNLLPSGRKLRTFASQPGLAAAFEPSDFDWNSAKPLPKELKDIHLILWTYEDWLKATFFDVLKIIESWSNDEVVFARGKAVDYVFQLLKDKPEQEANLLRLLVNKLGDSDKKIASKASFNILQLQTTHPLMKPMIIAAIESDIMFRSGQSLHAKYYATITLNQTVLSAKEDTVARKLLDIYFALFVQLLQKPEKAKATPIVAPKVTINKKGEIQGGGGAAGKKAEKKQSEKEKATTVDEDLREKMLSAVLSGVNRAIPFLNTNDESFEKHLNTLFEVTHSSNFNTGIQALMLVQQLIGSHQGSADRFYRTLYESLLDSRLLNSSKQALYLNLIFKALRSDLDVKRVKAFAKRLLQVVSMHQPSFTCGVLYMLRELEAVFPNLENFIDQPDDRAEDEEEHFQDVSEDNLNTETSRDDRPDDRTAKEVPIATYNGRKRDPSHASAECSTLWELTQFLNHYHPSVSLFATRLQTHGPMPAKPDLSLNTLIHFLDRFVYRNPKTTVTQKGASIMQPMAGSETSALLLKNFSGAGRKNPVNSEAFWKQEREKVGADEVFFHQYFSTLGRGKEKAKKKSEKRKAERVDSEDEGEEEEIWKALVDSRPEVEGGSDASLSDDDLDAVDMESDEEELDNEHDEGKPGEGDGQDDEDGFDFDDEDEEALLGSEDEVPSDLEQLFEEEMHSGKGKPITTEKSDEGSKRGNKKRRLKNLPTFASAEDYAQMLDDGDD